jgi:hypothetical protein
VAAFAGEGVVVIGDEVMCDRAGYEERVQS